MKIIGRYSPDIIAEALLELEVIRNAKNSHSLLKKKNLNLNVELEDWLDSAGALH